MEFHEIHFDTIDSTHTYAKLHRAEFPAGKITCVSAEGQTAGRGRFQRSWVSPHGVNLYVTFYFRLPTQTLHLISLAQVMAATFASLLLSEGLSPKIKWPNDVQLHGKKLSGVLCETSFQGEQVDIVLSIGINVNMEIDSLEKIDQPATSLKVETRRTWDRKSLLHQLQRQFAANLETFKKKGFTPFHNQYENLLAYKGQTIRCFDGKKEWVGICHSLTADGQLNLYLSDGRIQVISSGDVQASDADSFPS